MPGTSHGNLDKLIKSMSKSELEKMKLLAQKDPEGLKKILKDEGIHDSEAAIGQLKKMR